MNSPHFRSNDNDDEYYYRRGYHSSIPTSQMYSYPPPIEEPSQTLSQRLWEALEKLTSPNFAFLVTISIIIIVQARGPLERWYHNFIFRFRYMTVWEWIGDLWWTGLDYLRAIWHMTLELGRNSLRLLVPLSSSDATAATSQARRSRRLRRTQSRRSSTMPELEEVPATTAGGGVARNESQTRNLETRDEMMANGGRLHRWSQRELEPAFLRECDYPAGWAVFHPILGVVTKTEADKYELEREQRKTPDVEKEKKETTPVPVIAAKKPPIPRTENRAGPPYYPASSPSYVEDVVVAREASSSPIPQQPPAAGVPVLRSIAASG